MKTNQITSQTQQELNQTIPQETQPTRFVRKQNHEHDQQVPLETMSKVTNLSPKKINKIILLLFIVGGLIVGSICLYSIVLWAMYSDTSLFRGTGMAGLIFIPIVSLLITVGWFIIYLIVLLRKASIGLTSFLKWTCGYLLISLGICFILFADAKMLHTFSIFKEGEAPISVLDKQEIELHGDIIPILIPQKKLLDFEPRYSGNSQGLYKMEFASISTPSTMKVLQTRRDNIPSSNRSVNYCKQFTQDTHKGHSLSTITIDGQQAEFYFNDNLTAAFLDHCVWIDDWMIFISVNQAEEDTFPEWHDQHGIVRNIQKQEMIDWLEGFELPR
jgi:hypothetical protein